MNKSKRPRIRKRGCLIALVAAFIAWAVVTGIVGGLVYLVDKSV